MLDTKKIEEIVEALSHVIIAGKKISADKKVNLEDLPAAMELIVKLPSIAAAFADIKLAVEEAKDLANILKAGKLPAPTRIVEEAIVGPPEDATTPETVDLQFNPSLITIK
jgi:hypothetical protein